MRRKCDGSSGPPTVAWARIFVRIANANSYYARHHGIASPRRKDSGSTSHVTSTLRDPRLTLEALQAADSDAAEALWGRDTVTSVPIAFRLAEYELVFRIR